MCEGSTPAVLYTGRVEWAAHILHLARPGYRVQGHADERGTREYNLALSARRAQNTRDYVVSQGSDASRTVPYTPLTLPTNTSVSLSGDVAQ